MANTAFEYLYRDASNYKQGRRVIFAGEAIQELVDRIQGALDDGEFFIPSQVGLEDLQRSFPGGKVYEDDHVWHELIGIASTSEPASASESFAEFAARFTGIAWDVEAAIILNGLGEDDHPDEGSAPQRPSALIPAPARRESLRDALDGRRAVRRG